jgi:uncharacterized protein (DUF3820 family)
MIYNEPKENPKLNLNSKLHFGKYKDKTVKIILERINPFYLKWCLENIEWLKIDKDLRKEIEKDFIIDGGFKLPFGKYEGRNINYLLEKDFDYVIWFYEFLCDIYSIYFTKEIFEIYQGKLNERENNAVDEKKFLSEMYNFM